MDPITGITSKPFIHPNEVQPDGKLKPLTQAEEVINWKLENIISQNDILNFFDKKVDKIAEKIDETNEYLKAKYIPRAYKPKSARTTITSTSKTKRKVACFSASFSDSRDIPDTPPPKLRKEEQIHDKGFQFMEITRSYESPRKNYSLTESSAQKGDESSSDGNNNSYQETYADKTPRSFS
ncbi:hypothetical protein KIW84_051435 [Lathyrus oleraceus]|uniref:Uncharacterized protein n=1 Tax=Pisum sativum TaxID=3888 RepID=A0A9D4WM47_PEA|nr:hypothetical protein KIW84_051435 [Pisum sativum]